MGHFEDLFAIDLPDVVHDFEAGGLGVAVGLDGADLDGQGLVLAADDLEAPRLTRRLPGQRQLDNLLRHVGTLYLLSLLSYLSKKQNVYPEVDRHQFNDGCNRVCVYFLSNQKYTEEAQRWLINLRSTLHTRSSFF